MEGKSFSQYCSRLGMGIEQYKELCKLIKVDANIVYNMTRTYCVPGSGMYFDFEDALKSQMWHSTIREELRDRIDTNVYIEELTRELKVLGMEFMRENGKTLFRVV